jgi:hypothetical protein
MTKAASKVEIESLHTTYKAEIDSLQRSFEEEKVKLCAIIKRKEKVISTMTQDMNMWQIQLNQSRRSPKATSASDMRASCSPNTASKLCNAVCRQTGFLRS